MLIEFSQGFKKYFKNTGYLLFEKIVRILVALIVWAAVIRYLGPDQFGIFSYALSFVFLFSILSDLGLEVIVVHDLIKNADQKELILGSSFLLKFIGAIFATFLIVFTISVLSMEYHTRLVILVISLYLVFRSFNNIDFYFQSRVLSKYVVYSKLISLLATFILCLIFIRLKMPIVYFAYVVAIESAVLSFGLIVFYKMSGERIFSWRFNFFTMKALLGKSWPVIFSGLAISIYMRVDEIMIMQMLGAEANGYYSAAVRISEAFYFIPVVVTSSLFPAIVASKMESETLYYQRIRLLFTMLLWTSLFTAIGISSMASPLVRFLFGQQYLQSVDVLLIHVWAGIFVFLGSARSKWAINENLQAIIAAYTALGAVVNVVLNFILIPKFNIEGAAWATVISYFVVAVLGNLFSRKTRKIFFLQIKSFNFLALWKDRILSKAL